jgi:hypothetical protein
MTTTFSLADDRATEMLAEIMEKYHQCLFGQEVKVGLIMARSITGHAIKVGGYPAIAKVKVVPLADRLTKGYDAEIQVDQWWWESDKLPDERRRAVLDHELCHLKLARDESGHPKRDDLGRPKLKLVRGDWNGGDGFACIIERHGNHAQESHNFDAVVAAVKAAREPKPTLFDDVKDAIQAAAEGVGLNATVTFRREGETPAEASTELWRDFPLSQLGLRGDIEAAVRSMCNDRLGDLATQLEANADYGLAEIDLAKLRVRLVETVATAGGHWWPPAEASTAAETKKRPASTTTAKRRKAVS